jgi:hypothetical protein
MLAFDGVVRAHITYANEGGGTSQENGVTLSWSKVFIARRNFPKPESITSDYLEALAPLLFLLVALHFLVAWADSDE